MILNSNFYSFKVRLYPNKQQKSYIDKTLGCVRKVFNETLNHKIEYYNQTGFNENSSETQNWVQHTLLKSEEFFYLQEQNTNVMKIAYRNVEQAFSNHLKYDKVGFPNFKKKGVDIDSATFFKGTAISKKNLSDGKLHLVKGLIGLNYRTSKEYKQFMCDNKHLIKKITIKKLKDNTYHASILFENENENENGFEDFKKNKIVETPLNYAIGFDLGIKELVVFSDGKIIPNEKFFRTQQKKLKSLSKAFSRTKKDYVNGEGETVKSKGREKARLKLAKHYHKISNKTNDFLHNISKQIINENQVVCLEDLNVSGMMKNHKLAKATQELSLGEFIRQLKYKSEWFKRDLVQIGQFYPSTQTCSGCGNRKMGEDKLDLSDRTYDCHSCGLSIDRDLNASKNILKEGLRILQESVVGSDTLTVS